MTFFSKFYENLQVTIISQTVKHLRHCIHTQIQSKHSQTLTNNHSFPHSCFPDYIRTKDPVIAIQHTSSQNDVSRAPNS